MASADHAGNGSDQMKAYILQFSEGGTTMENAEALAKAIIRSYRKEVLHGAAVYLAFNKSAGEAELRQYLRWAEEDIRQKEAYRDLPIPSWSDELEAKRQEAVSNDRQSREVENNNNSITLITYEDDHTQHFKLQNGEEEIYCTLCNQIDNHLTDCPNAAEERLIFSAIQASEQEAFWRREINGIFAETVE